MKRTRFSLSILLLAVCTSSFAADDRTPLKIFHAGSLAVPFEAVEKVFEAEHPDIDVRREASGSVAAIRKVTDLGKQAHVVASADYRIIDSMMINAPEKWTEWNIMFARNALCLALSPKNPAAAGEDWFSKMSAEGVKIGISNPNLDPCGYRSVMVLYLIQEQLGKAGVFDNMVLNATNITVTPGEERTMLNVPDGLKVDRKGTLVVRPKETDLIPLLETSVIDCLLIYRSVALQHDMDFVELPVEINLSDPDRDDAYGTVGVNLRAGTDKAKSVRGSAIVYGVTVPTNAPDPELGRAFVRLLQSERGRAILEEQGQAPLPAGTASSATKVQIDLGSAAKR